MLPAPLHHAMTNLIIDSHQHFWNLANPWCNWPTADEAAIHRDYHPKDILPHLEATGIDRTILVQAAPDIHETWAMLTLAEHTDFIAGVIGWVNFEDGNQSIKDIDQLSVSPYLVGIRPMLQSKAQTDWILQPKFIPLLNALAKRGLVFDALIQPRHLPTIKLLALRHPDLKIVINHGAKPDIATRDFHPWADSLLEVAQFANVSCKLSGLLTEAKTNDDPEVIQKYSDAIINAFGPKRILWGSDWPVVELNGNYTGWHDMCRLFLALLSQTDRDAIFGGNAANLYNLAL